MSPYSKECSDETLSIFWKKHMYEKLGISEMKFATVCIFDFCKNMNPRFYILFLADESMT